MQIQSIFNNQTVFNGYLKFKNKTIDANDIAEFNTKTVRKPFTPKECPSDLFIWNAVGSNVYNYRYYDEESKSLDWIQVKMKIGNDPSSVSITGSQHEVSFYDGIVDHIKGKLLMKNGKKYNFEFQRPVTPPTLKQLNIYSGVIKKLNYPKAPIPQDYLIIDDIITKAKKEDGIFKIDAELKGCFFNLFKSDNQPAIEQNKTNNKIENVNDDDEESIIWEYLRYKLAKYKH